MTFFVHFHLFAAKIFNTFDKICQAIDKATLRFANAVHAWCGRRCDYHIDAARDEIKRLENENADAGEP